MYEKIMRVIQLSTELFPLKDKTVNENITINPGTFSIHVVYSIALFMNDYSLQTYNQLVMFNDIFKLTIDSTNKDFTIGEKEFSTEIFENDDALFLSTIDEPLLPLMKQILTSELKSDNFYIGIMLSHLDYIIEILEFEYDRLIKT